MVSFRPLHRSDFPLLKQWLSEPHVDKWWNEPLNLAGIEDKYGPRVDKIDPTNVFIMEHEGRSVGWIQWYRWKDYPKHSVQLGAGPNNAGIDITIGKPELIGLGIGPTAIRNFLKQIVFFDEGIASVIVDVDERNSRSLGAFEKVGFSPIRSVQLEGEDCIRKVMRLYRQEC